MTSMPTFVLSPCGTSLLANSAQGDERRALIQQANAPSREEIASQQPSVLAVVERACERLRASDAVDAARMSAEINAILQIYDGSLASANSQDVHYLLCTDTWLGEVAGEAIAAWLRDHGLTVQVQRQVDLQTRDQQAFQASLADLAKWCEQTLPGYRASRFRIVFNLTAGFKSVQGFLLNLAMFYADEAVYIFESGDSLLRIPRLPVELNAEPIVASHLEAFRRLAMQLSVDARQIVDIPETLLLTVGEQVTLSEWGTLVWNRTRGQLYERKLHPPPSGRIVYGPQFERSVAGLSSERLYYINYRLDPLARFLEGEQNDRLNPRSLRFHALQGNPTPPSTHEFYAWSDRGAARVYGHFEGNLFVLDRLGEHL
ncbi:MAG: putative CRISPR-associated protein [Planctomycetales bacterium]|nr:putative CRISPR-associated protein [Planctomycetales bacterium]